MTNVTNHERPGVYSVYDASGIVDGSGGAKAVGLIAQCTAGTAGECYVIDKYDDAVSLFGGGQEITELVRLLFLNGARQVTAVPVADAEGYTAAIGALEAVEDVYIVVCDSTDIAVQQAVRDSVETASEARKERIAVLSGGAGETVSELTARAAGLNSQRVVLTGPEALTVDGSGAGVARVAAAVAGAIAKETDPAIPLGGAELKGLGGLTAAYTDNEVDTLILGGVTPVESVGGTVSVIRGVTTKTTTGGEADATWRELTTILVVDEVIPGIRSALRGRFQRAKNTEQTRGAIRSQVIMELENRVDKEIITGYDKVTVAQVADNPTVCLVEFAFAAAHGLNQIWLSAHITV